MIGSFILLLKFIFIGLLVRLIYKIVYYENIGGLIFFVVNNMKNVDEEIFK